MAKEIINVNKEQDKVSAWKKRRQERKQQSKEEEEASIFSNVINENDHETEFVPLSRRRRLEDELLQGSRRRFRQKVGSNGKDETIENTEKEERCNSYDKQNGEQGVESLLESAAALQKSLTEEQKVEKQKDDEEERIMREASKVQTCVFVIIVRNCCHKEFSSLTCVESSFEIEMLFRRHLR